MAFGAPFPGGGLIVTPVGGATGGVGGQAFTLNFGPAFSGRYLVAAIAGFCSTQGPPTGCTIGGVSAKLLVTGINGFNNATFAYGQIYIAEVPEGTSGQVVTSGPAVGGELVQLYSLAGLSSPTPDAVATGSTSASIAVLGGGVVIAASGAFSVGVGLSSWSGLSVDENATIQTNVSGSCAHGWPLPAETLNASVSWGGSGRAFGLAMASFH